MALPELNSNILPDNAIITTHTQDGAEVISQLQQNPNEVESYISTSAPVYTTHNVVPQVLTVLKENGQDITTVVEGFWDVVWSVNGQTGDVTIDAVAGNFIPNHTYRQNSIIMHEGHMYRALSDFTTASTFNPADWAEILPQSAIVFDLFQANHHYYARQPIWRNNFIYVANTEFTSGNTFNPSDWTRSGGIASITSDDGTVTVTASEEIVDLSVQESLDPIVESLEDKVDKIAGKGLSTNDYTTFEKTKLSGIEAGAEKNALNTVIDANYVHTDNNYTTTEKTNLANIKSYVPAQATVSNQLADKAFVNSSVQTATANFRGNWEDWASVPIVGEHYPEDYAGGYNPTVNDYLVVRDTEDYHPWGEFNVLDYIEASGTQYIDTGLKATPNTSTSVTMAFLSNTRQQRVFGTQQANAGLIYAMYINSSGYVGVVRSDNTGSWTYIPSSTVPLNVIRTYELDGYNKIAKWYDGDVELGSKDLSSYTATLDSYWNLTLLARYENSAIGDFATGRLYRASVSESGNVVRNFIPARANGYGKNLFNSSLSDVQTWSSASATNVDNGIQVTNTSQWHHRYRVIVLPNSDRLLGKTISLHSDISISSGQTAAIRIYSVDTTTNSFEDHAIFARETTGSSLDATVTFPSTYYRTQDNAFAILLYSNIEEMPAGVSVTYSNIQLEFGTERTEYEAYYEPGSIGLYDLIGKKFYQSPDRSKFTAGNEVNKIIRPGVSPMVQEAVPERFQELEYIESTGAQYINTGVSRYPSIDIDFSTSDTDNVWRAMWGRRGSSSSTNFAGFVNGATRKFSPNYAGYDPGASSDVVLTSDERVNIRNNLGKFYVNGVEKLSTGNTLAGSDVEMFLFENNQNGAEHGRKVKAKLYGCKLFSDQNLVRNFIPAETRALSPNLVVYNDTFRSGSAAAGVTSTVLSTGELQVTAEQGNNNYLAGWWDAQNDWTDLENSLEEGDTFTVIFTIKKTSGSTGTPTVYLKDGMGYYHMSGTAETEYSEIYYTGTWKDANSISPHLGWSSCEGTFTIKNWEIKKGAYTHYEPYYESGEVGLYDTVNDRFYINSGTGEFVAGPAKYQGTWRFKYSGEWERDGKSGWQPEYQVNETPMTAAQLAALNSGITAQAWSSIGSAVETNTTSIANLDRDKVDKVTGKGLSTNDYTTADKQKITDLYAIRTITRTVGVVTDWTDAGIDYDDLDGTGTYIVDVYTPSGVTGLYSEHYVGIMSWYADGTNSSNSCEVLLHNAGHADNSQRLYLRTLRHGGGSTGLRLTLQYAFASASGGATPTQIELTFKFRRLI